MLNRLTTGLHIRRICTTAIVMSNGQLKKLKKTVKIGTHNGMFHCDEALACFMLKQLPEYTDAEIVRSRDPEVLKDCDIVVDVGAVYNPAIHRYDHHQRSFEETLSRLKPNFKNFNVKLSSAGLIYVHFGERIIADATSLTEDAVSILYELIYSHIIEEIDAIDNGVPICEGEPTFKISTDISSRVKRLNPDWNHAEEVDSDALFKEAMSIVGSEFTDKLSYFSKIWWPARETVAKSLNSRFDVHSSGQIIELGNRVPWKQHLFDLEKKLKIEGSIIYALFKDQAGSWRVQGVSVTPDSFLGRKFLKKEWRGVRDEELSTISGIPGCIFCHSSGFIGGNHTREGALQMAIRSLGDD